MVMLNMGEILKVHAMKHPRKMALKDWRGKTLTYLELEARTNRRKVLHRKLREKYSQLL